MKKKPASRSAFFNPRALFGFGIFSMALFLALFALARPASPVKSIPTPEVASNVAADSFAVENVQGDQMPVSLQLPAQELEYGNVVVPQQATSCTVSVLPNTAAASTFARAPSTRYAGARQV